MVLNEDDRQAFLAYSLVSENKAKLLHGEGVNVSHFHPYHLRLATIPTFC